LSLVANPNAASAPPADNNVPAQAGAPVVEARATATDARGSDADGKSDQLSDRAAPAQTPIGTTASIGSIPAAPMSAASSVPQPTDQTAANSPGNSSNSPWPDPSQSVGGQQLQTATAAGDSSDALPASAPLIGPIPLPPHRPKVFAMADGPIPLPRRRPADTDTASEPSPDNGNFLTHLFGQTH